MASTLAIESRSRVCTSHGLVTTRHWPGRPRNPKATRHSDGQASLAHTPHTPAAETRPRLGVGAAPTWAIHRTRARDICTLLQKAAGMSSGDSKKLSGPVRERCSSLLPSCSQMQTDIIARPSLQKPLSGSPCDGVGLCPSHVQPSCHSVDSVDRRLRQKYIGRLCYLPPETSNSPQRTPVETTVHSGIKHARAAGLGARFSMINRRESR